MAAGLANMVATMSRGKKAYLQYESQLSAAIARLATLREELKASIDADAESYNSVMKAYKDAKSASDEAAAQTAVDAALKHATSVPVSVAEKWWPFSRKVGYKSCVPCEKKLNIVSSAAGTP